MFSIRLSTLALLLAGSAFSFDTDLRLIQAVKRGDVALARTALAQGVDVNGAEADGSTALLWAAMNEDVALTEMLLAAHANVDAATRYNVTPLSVACLNGNAAIVKRLLDAGANPNGASREGETVLMTAARNGNAEAVKMLLVRGANPNATEPFRNQTAMMWAAGEGNAGALNMLIEFGGNVKAKSRAGYTALLLAVRNNQIETARALLDHGANIDDVGPDGTSALNMAVVNAYFDLASILLDYGANPNIADPRGSPLLTVAWLRKPGTTWEAAALAEQPITAPRPTGKVTALELVEKLLAKGADPNARAAFKEMHMTKLLGTTANPPDIPLGRHYLSYVGATAFYVAAHNGDVALMRVLVKGGADPKIATKAGVTPLMAAAALDYYEGETPGPFTGVSEAERLEAVKLALELGNDVNAETHLGDYPMIGNAEFTLMTYPENMDDLLDLGVGDPRFDRCTALDGAVISNQPSILKYLIEHGAKLDHKNRLGWTALMISRGIFMANSKKEFPQAEKILMSEMAQRGLLAANEVAKAQTQISH